MKKRICLVLALCLLLSGCSIIAKDQDTAPATTVTTVPTTPPYAPGNFNGSQMENPWLNMGYTVPQGYSTSAEDMADYLKLYCAEEQEPVVELWVNSPESNIALTTQKIAPETDLQALHQKKLDAIQASLSSVGAADVTYTDWRAPDTLSFLGREYTVSTAYTRTYGTFALKKLITTWVLTRAQEDRFITLHISTEDLAVSLVQLLEGFSCPDGTTYPLPQWDDKADMRLLQQTLLPDKAWRADYYTVYGAYAYSYVFTQYSLVYILLGDITTPYAGWTSFFWVEGDVLYLDLVYGGHLKTVQYRYNADPMTLTQLTDNSPVMYNYEGFTLKIVPEWLMGRDKIVSLCNYWETYYASPEYGTI